MHKDPCITSVIPACFRNDIPSVVALWAQCNSSALVDIAEVAEPNGSVSLAIGITMGIVSPNDVDHIVAK